MILLLLVVCRYLDLYLIHWPQVSIYPYSPHILTPLNSLLQNWEHVDGQHVSFTKNEDGSMKYTDVPLMDTWAALEACVDEGLIRSIGLSNFNETQIQEIYDNGRIKPAMLQVLPEYCQRPRNVPRLFMLATHTCTHSHTRTHMSTSSRCGQSCSASFTTLLALNGNFVLPP